MPKNAEKIAHLDDVASSTPEYAELLAPFRGIFSLLEGREGKTGLAFHLPTAHWPERIAGGLPLLDRHAMRVNHVEAPRFLLDLVDLLRRAGKEGGEHLAALEAALIAGSLDLPSLFAACLHRDRRAMDAAAASLGIPAPLLEFVVETPLKAALELAAEGIDPQAVAGWKEGYCPVCGSRPGMGELSGDEGRRHLSCSACSFRWPFARLACPHCGNADPDKLTYFEAGEGPVRVDVCRSCSRYIKTRDSRRGHAGVPLDAEDLATIHLDLLASREGLERGK